MLQMDNRPTIPKSFIANLNKFGQSGEAITVIQNPVCISVEHDFLTVEDVIGQIDFSSISRLPRRSKTK